MKGLLMIDEPNFSNSGGTVLTDEKDVHGSGPQWSSSLDSYIGGQGEQQDVWSKV